MKKTLLRGLAMNACVLAAVAAYTPSVVRRGWSGADMFHR